MNVLSVSYDERCYWLSPSRWSKTAFHFFFKSFNQPTLRRLILQSYLSQYGTLVARLSLIGVYFLWLDSACACLFKGIGREVRFLAFSAHRLMNELLLNIWLPAGECLFELATSFFVMYWSGGNRFFLFINRFWNRRRVGSPK